MKIFFNLLMAVVVIAFVGCSKDDETIELKQSEVSLYSGDKFQIEAMSNSGLTFRSENEYHAVVSETGLVTALFVGQTNIVVSDGNDSKNFRVTIRPKSSLYPEPYINWGASRAEVIAYNGTPDSDDEDGLVYNEYANADMLMYLFDEADKLKSVGVVIKSSYTSEISTYLSERYLPIDASSESYTILFVNGISPETTTTLIGAGLLSLSHWMVIYLPYEKSASSLSLEAPVQITAKAQALIAK